MRQAGPHPSTDAVVWWFVLNPDGWVVTDACEQAAALVGHCLWDIYPEMEAICVPHHRHALRYGSDEFVTTQGTTWFVQTRRRGSLLDVMSVDMEAFRESLHRLDSDREGHGQSRPSLQLLSSPR
jgi:hypothetical protein